MVVPTSHKSTLLRSLVCSSILAVGLAYDTLANYEPRTLITNHASIDMDQQEIEHLLDLGLFSAAQAIYKQGAYSNTMAKITLLNAEPPDAEWPVGTIVYGWADDSDGVTGTLAKAAYWTETQNVELLVEYTPQKSQSEYLDCFVGGLVLTDSETLDGCYASNGYIQLTYLSRTSMAHHYNYTYNMRADNYNGRTIENFSANAYSEMWNCTGCPYNTYKKFVRYYGEPDYGNAWVSAAFEGSQTTFDQGNIDFATENKDVRSEAVRVATKYWIVWMYVIRQMEYAVSQCEEECTIQSKYKYAPSQEATCDDGPIKAWDQAVAYYVGSLEEGDGTGEGYLLYDLADKMCVFFGTCGSMGDSQEGTSLVNELLIDAFMERQSDLLLRRCSAPRKAKDAIVEYMTVPLVQATILNSFQRWLANSTDTTDQESRMLAVEGATLSGSILPLVAHCNAEDATILHNNMRLKGEDEEDEVDFLAVKEALERNYKCLGITCGLVGGLMVDGEYAMFTSPCVDPIEDEGGLVYYLVVASVVLVASVGSVAGSVVIRRRNAAGIDYTYHEEQNHGPSPTTMTTDPADMLESVEIN
eukprot:Nitzschia sp. Nitz4//scaffold426_size8320//3116//5024//NITZ4_009127-RA/size8320-processed-gene-0.3-mRNA-1//1//CDS//3329551615//5495//frame0